MKVSAQLGRNDSREDAIGLARLRPRIPITTPENVTFYFEPAGLATRGAAWVVDAFLVGVGFSILAFFVALFSTVAPGPAAALFFVGAFLLQWWYGVLFEWLWRGRTPGKSLFGLRVLERSGLPITFGQAVVRNLLRMVDLLPAFYLTGVISICLDPAMRRLGDIAAGTIVVLSRRLPAPTAVVPPSARYNSFLDDPRVIAAAKRVLPAERDVMITLSLRREHLPLGVRHALFARLSARLEERLGVPRPSYFSEEKYVLHLTAALLSGH